MSLAQHKRAWLAALALWLPSAALAQSIPWEGTLNAGGRMQISIRHGEGTTELRARARGAEALAELPIAQASRFESQVVQLAGAQALVIRVMGAEDTSAAAVLVVARGRASVLWTGRLSPSGDRGEQTRDVLIIEDKTGDGVDDLIVGRSIEGRGICGQDNTLLEARAVDPRGLVLRPVQLRNLPEVASEPEVVATTQSPGPSALPLLQALQSRGASSVSGIRGVENATPRGLVDGEPSTLWIEGNGGDGRFEFASLRWNAPGFAIRAFAIVPVSSDASLTRVTSPETFWLVGDDSRIRVRIPEEPQPGQVWWVVPPSPLQWSCVSLVLDAPRSGARDAATGIAELRAYSDLDFGGGIEGLVARLALGGNEGDTAARLLSELGGPAVDPIRQGWADRSPAERRLAVRALEWMAPRVETARVALEQAAQDNDAEVREAALEALIRVGEPAYESLARLIAQPEVGDQAALALARAAPSFAIDPVLASMSLEGAEGRVALREALRVAVQRGAEGERTAVEAWIANEQTPIAAIASASLALAGGGQELESLAAMVVQRGISAEAFEDRWRLIKAAARLPSAEAIDTWLGQQASGAEEWMTRAAAVDALHQREASRRRDIARAALEDEYPRVRVAAIRALAGHAEDVERLAIAARRDRWPMVRSAGVLSLIGSERALPVVRAAARDRAQSVRAAAVDALRQSQDWESWELVDGRLRDEGEWPEVLRAGVAFARDRCRPDAIEALSVVLERAFRPNPWAPDIDVAAAAVEAAAAIGSDDAERLLQRAATESAPAAVRRAAELARARHPSCN